MKDESCPHYDVCLELYPDIECPGEEKCLEPYNSFWDGIEANERAEADLYGKEYDE